MLYKHKLLSYNEYMKNRIKHSKGYWLLPTPDHPYASHSGYVPEHRLVMERHLGRYINPLVEEAHHNDGDVCNNEISNLTLVTKKEHRRLHAGWIIKDGEWWKTCTHCGSFLRVDGNFYERKTGHNEYVTMCKNCIRKIATDKRPANLTPEERSTRAKVSSYKAWATRRSNSGGG